MIPKPEIQYVGQFYVHGSEARKLELLQRREEKTAKTSLPLERLRKIEKIYLDPTALAAMAVAVIMLVTMVMGGLQLEQDWKEYRALSQHVSELNRENARLTRELRSSYDLEEVRIKAVGIGLVPVEQVPVKTVAVTVPEAVEEPGWLEAKLEYIRWFWKGLWA